MAQDVVETSPDEMKNEAELSRRRSILEEVLSKIENENQVIIKNKQKS